MRHWEHFSQCFVFKMTELNLHLGYWTSEMSEVLTLLDFG